MKGVDSMLSRSDWYAPWFNRTRWFFENVERFSLEPPEILMILAIIHLQDLNAPIDPTRLSALTGLDMSECDNVLDSLAAKGCLTLDTRNKDFSLLLDILLDQAASDTLDVSRGVLAEVESEFSRPLSASEMERISRLAGEFSEDTILHALDECAAYDKRSVAYLEAVLSAWKAKGLSDEDIELGRR